MKRSSLSLGLKPFLPCFLSQSETFDAMAVCTDPTHKHCTIDQMRKKLKAKKRKILF